MDELKEKIKKALDESETYGDFYIKLRDMPEFRKAVNDIVVGKFDGKTLECACILKAFLDELERY